MKGLKEEIAAEKKKTYEFEGQMKVIKLYKIQCFFMPILLRPVCYCCMQVLTRELMAQKSQNLTILARMLEAAGVAAPITLVVRGGSKAPFPKNSFPRNINSYQYSNGNKLFLVRSHNNRTIPPALKNTVRLKEMFSTIW